MRATGSLCAVVATIGALGCGNQFTPSPRMADAPAAVPAPNPTGATLVFIRPSKYVGVWNAGIYVDGRYVFDMEAERKVVLVVPPGAHKIVGSQAGMTKGCRQLDATVEANKIYFIHSSMAFGAELTAVKPTNPELKEWLARTTMFRAAVPGAADPLDAEEKRECHEKAAEKMRDENPEEKAKHTMLPADGFAAHP
jgi:hypothetical protein